MPAEKTQVFSLAAFVSSFTAFLFGLVSAYIIEAVKRRREKQRLINLFIDEIRRSYLEIDRKKSAGPSLARSKSELFSVGGVSFAGMPEYQLEVYNAKLFETEGVKLAEQLPTAGRKAFWAAYGPEARSQVQLLLRDAEAIRQVLKGLSKGEQDYESYQKVFIELILKATNALGVLERALKKERSFVEGVRDMRAAPK